jgi:activator of HSP90 ATPase
MKESITLTEVFAVPPAVLYAAWLDSAQHSAMTGGAAECSELPGASFTAWDGYISGQNLELVPHEKIVQAWRTEEFDESDEDSLLTLTLRAVEEGTALTLIHTEIPEGQTQYAQGWVDHYFLPMKDYFGT